MTTVFAPPAPTAAQLDESFWWGVRVAAALWPVSNYEAESALIVERRAGVPAGGILDRFFDGAVDCLTAMRQVQRTGVTA